MKTISSELDAAQKSLGASPFVQSVVVSEGIGNVPRLRWTLLDWDTAIPESHYHTAVITSGGRLVRIRCGDNGLGQQTIWSQSCEYPENSSTWPGWTQVAANTTGGRPALIEGQDGVLYLFYISATGTGIRMKTSADGGVSWSADNAVASHTSGQIKAVAAAFRPSDGAIGLFWAFDAGTTAPAVSIYYSLRSSGGGWSAKAAWSLPAVYSISGLDAHYCNDWNIVYAGHGEAAAVSGATVYHPGVWAVQLADGGDGAAGQWAKTPVKKAAGGSGFRYFGPSLMKSGSCYRLAFVEQYRGRDAFTRVQHTYHPLDFFGEKRWPEPIPFDYAGVTGLTFLHKPAEDRSYLIGPGKGWSSQLGTLTTDLTTRILRYEAVQEQSGSGLVVELDNSDGALASAGTGAAFAALRPGAEVRISRGYITGNGSGEAVELPSYWVQAIEFDRQAGSSIVRLRCKSAWSLLDAIEVERPLSFYNTTAQEIVRTLASMAGLAVEWQEPASSESAARLTWVVEPGEQLGKALKRILAIIPEWSRARGSGLELGMVPERLSPGYRFGPTAHHVRASVYCNSSSEVNHVQVYGSVQTVVNGEPAKQTLFGEAIDFEEAAASGHRLRKMYDPTAGSDAEAASRAGITLAGFTGARETGSIVVSPVVNLEQWDLVEVNDAPAGLTRSIRLVNKLVERFDAGRALFEQEISFGPERGKGFGMASSR